MLTLARGPHEEDASMTQLHVAALFGAHARCATCEHFAFHGDLLDVGNSERCVLAPSAFLLELVAATCPCCRVL